MIDRRGLFGAGFGAGTLAFASRAMAETPPPPATMRALDALRQGKSTVGGVLVAARGGRTAAIYAWGEASVPFQVPVTERTLFHLGSNAKEMTAIAVLQLVEAGKAALEDPIGRHVRGLPDAIARATVAQLLHQTSGVVEYGDLLPDWDRPQTRDVVLGVLKDKPPVFEPGARWAYSNTNYLLLGWLLEDVTGLSYAELVRQRLFEPAGLPTARADAAQRIVPNRAEPYEVTAEGVRHAVRMEDGVSRAADGGLLFSALDVAPWRAALDRNRLVSAATMARANSPGMLNSGRLAPYGHGVFLQRTRGQRLFSHSGGVPGFISNRMTWPDADLSILCMVNSASRTGVSLDSMVLTLAEGLQPGITWQGLEPRPADARTRALTALLTRPEGEEAPAGLLAEEFAGSSPAALRRVRPGTTLAPLESWLVGDSPRQGEMTRYRVTRDDGVRDLVVGWTPDDRIYWFV